MRSTILVALFPSLLRSGTSSANTREPSTSAPGFAQAICATATMSSGACCPSASAVTTTGTSGNVAEDGVDAGLQRGALAEIDGVADDANLRVRRGFVEARAKPEAAAVIDHEDALDAEANEVGDEAGEIRARFVSGDEHHEVRVRHARVV